MDWRLTVHPDDLNKAMSAVRAMLDHGKSQMEILAVRKDGSLFWRERPGQAGPSDCKPGRLLFVHERHHRARMTKSRCAGWRADAVAFTADR